MIPDSYEVVLDDYNQVSEELKRMAAEQIRDYAAKKKVEVDSRKAASALLARASLGKVWREATNYPSETIGIAIREVLEKEDGWKSERIQEPSPGYRIYRRC